jgi:hypothetical protein
LNTGAGSLDVRLACLDYRDAPQKSLPAGLGEFSEVLLDARSDATLSGLHSLAMLLDLCRAGMANRHLLGHAAGWHQK